MALEWSMRRAAAGLRDGLTFVPSVAILGAIFGASSRSAGISPWVATAMSMLVWSGSGQFAALPLWQSNGFLISLSTMVLSLRFSLMTASMAPRLAGAPAWLRALLPFGITDENYALAITRRSGAMEPDYLAGAFFAAQVPPAWTGPLNSVFPIVFLTLAVLCANSRPAAGVAVLGAILAVVGRLYLPGGWHVVVAGVVASLAGPLLERYFPAEEQP